MRTAIEALQERFSRLELNSLSDINCDDIISPDFLDQFDIILAQNQLTPQVSYEFINQFYNRRQEIIAALSQVQLRFEQMGIKSSNLEPGAAEIGLLIPRNSFENKLGEMVKELGIVNRILRIFSEVATGKAEEADVYIRSLQPIRSSFWD